VVILVVIGISFCFLDIGDYTRNYYSILVKVAVFHGYYEAKNL